jgi:hypothetical protein
MQMVWEYRYKLSLMAGLVMVAAAICAVFAV